MTSFSEKPNDDVKITTAEDAIGKEKWALPFEGGERAGLARLQAYFFETHGLSRYKTTRNGLLGTEYSSKFSAFLAFGFLSARHIAEEVRNYEERVQANESTYWMLFELLWRDYFVLLAAKYGAAMFKPSGLRSILPGKCDHPDTPHPE